MTTPTDAKEDKSVEAAAHAHSVNGLGSVNPTAYDSFIKGHTHAMGKCEKLVAALQKIEQAGSRAGVDFAFYKARAALKEFRGE